MNASPAAKESADLESDFMLVMVSCFAEIVAADITDRIRLLRFTAVKEVEKYLWHYQELGYMQKLLLAIAEKKCEQIGTITSKTEMEKLVRPHCPHYNGKQFVPDEYNILEEELICWSQASLEAPLNEMAFRRYMELFKEVFPEESKPLPT